LWVCMCVVLCLCIGDTRFNRLYMPRIMRVVLG
jgi:hypothetical protein